MAGGPGGSAGGVAGGGSCDDDAGGGGETAVQDAARVLVHGMEEQTIATLAILRLLPTLVLRNVVGIKIGIRYDAVVPEVERIAQHLKVDRVRVQYANVEPVGYYQCGIELAIERLDMGH